VFRDSEVPQGAIDGTNRVFTLQYAPDPPQSLLLVLNGVVQRPGADFTLSGNVITYVYPPQPGDSHIAWYRTTVGPFVTTLGLTKSEAISLISSRLGSRTGLDDYIVQELIMAQHALEATEPLPWFLVAAATLGTSAGVEHVTLPDDFLREHAESGHTSSAALQVSGGWRPLQKVGVHRIQDMLPLQGPPTYYAVVGDKIYFRPIPDTSYAINILYYARDANLGDVDKNRWLTYAPDVLVSYAGRQVARYLRDQSAAVLFQEDLTLALQRLATQTISRAVASTDPRFKGFEDE